MSGRVLRLGLIGAGRWGRNYIKTIDQLSCCRITAIATRSGPGTEFAAGYRWTTEWRDIIRDIDVDGVIIATPPSSHAEIVLEAIAARKAILVEKPLTCSRVEGASILAAFTKNPTVFMIDHIHLHHPAFRALADLAGEVGQIQNISSAAGNLGPYRADVSVLWDWAPHDVSMSLSLVPGYGRPIYARGVSRGILGGGRGAELDLCLELRTSIRHNIILSTLRARHRSFVVHFDSEKMVYSDQGEHSLVRYRKKATGYSDGQPVLVCYEPPLTRVVRRFCEAIRRGETSFASLDLGLAVVNLIAETEQLLTIQDARPQ